jgi:hypothetical protein
MKTDIAFHGVLPIFVGVTIIIFNLTNIIYPINYLSMLSALFPIFIGVRNIQDILRRRDWYN